MLSRDQILGVNDLPTDTFPVPAWGGDVTIRTLDGEQREDLENRIGAAQAAKGQPGRKSQIRALAAAYSLVDGDGKTLFALSDVPLLAKKSGTALDVIFDRVLKFNAMTKEEAGEIAKN
jgi:hypothetical protein